MRQVFNHCAMAGLLSRRAESALPGWLFLQAICDLGPCPTRNRNSSAQSRPNPPKSSQTHPFPCSSAAVLLLYPAAHSTKVVLLHSTTQPGPVTSQTRHSQY